MSEACGSPSWRQSRSLRSSGRGSFAPSSGSCRTRADSKDSPLARAVELEGRAPGRRRPLPVGICRATLADSGECALQRLLFLHEDDGQPPSLLAVCEPVRLDPGLLECGYDLVLDVRDAGLEFVRRLVLETDDLCSHAAI